MVVTWTLWNVLYRIHWSRVWHSTNWAFAADKTLRLTRCNILHAEETMLATMSVSRYTHYLPKCIILNKYTAYKSIFLLSAESVSCILCTRVWKNFLGKTKYLVWEHIKIQGVTKTLSLVKCFVQNPLIQSLTVYQLSLCHFVRVHAADKTLD